MRCRHCVYCGADAPSFTCAEHADLPDRDVDFYGWRMRRWWLDRFTAAEIEEMAAGLAYLDRIVTPPRELAIVGRGANV